jgi:hypothetical protein
MMAGVDVDAQCEKNDLNKMAMLLTLHFIKLFYVTWLYKIS